MTHIIRHLLYHTQKLKRTGCQAMVKYNLSLKGISLKRSILWGCLIIIHYFCDPHVEVKLHRERIAVQVYGPNFASCTVRKYSSFQVLKYWKQIRLMDSRQDWARALYVIQHPKSLTHSWLQEHTFWLHTLSKWDRGIKNIYGLEVLKSYVKSKNTIIQRGFHNITILKLTAMF